MSQQIVIDSLSFAREGRSLQGELPISGLERLHDVLAEIAGSVVFRLNGRIGRQDKPQLLLEVSGRVPVICQRCLGRLDWPVAQATEVLLAGNGEELTRLDDASEGEVILADRPLEPAMLVEDELVLTLPFAPRHEGACPSGP